MIEIPITEYSFTQTWNAFQDAKTQLGRDPAVMFVHPAFELYMEQAMKDAAAIFGLPAPYKFHRPLKFLSAEVVTDNKLNNVLCFA